MAGATAVTYADILDKLNSTTPIYSLGAINCTYGNFSATEKMSDAGSAVSRNYNDAQFSYLDFHANRAEEELERYSHFVTGWDGYDGKPFSEKVLQIAEQILVRIKNLYACHGGFPESIDPGPASDGSLDIEFFGCSKKLTYTIDPEGERVECFAYDFSKNATVDSISSEINLEQQFLWLVS